MKEVVVVIDPDQIGQAIARRAGVAKHVLLADMRVENANAAAEVLGNAGYEVSVATVDASSRQAVHALVELATGLGKSPASSMPPASPRQRRRPPQSPRSTSTARLSCWRRSGPSSPGVAPAASSPHSPGTGCRR